MSCRGNVGGGGRNTVVDALRSRIAWAAWRSSSAGTRIVGGGKGGGGGDGLSSKE